MEDKLKSKITSELENRTLDKIIKPNQSSEDDLMDTLFGDGFYTEDFYNSLMEQLEQQEEAAQNTEGAADGDPFADPDMEGVDGDGIPKVKGELIKADELRPEVVEFVTNAVIERLHKEQSNQIVEYVHGKVISQEEWYKLILWKYFPIIGIPIYFLFLVLLNRNIDGKYDRTLQNYSKAELKTFWIYTLVHIIVVFTCCAAVISLINIFQRGLMA